MIITGAYYSTIAILPEYQKIIVPTRPPLNFLLNRLKNIIQHLSEKEPFSTEQLFHCPTLMDGQVANIKPATEKIIPRYYISAIDG